LVINFYFKEAFSKWSRDLNLDDWPRTWVHFCLKLGWMVCLDGGQMMMLKVHVILCITNNLLIRRIH
jgi:hypothetical protein